MSSDVLTVLTVVFSAAVTNNILLTNYLGMCSFLAISRDLKASAGLGTAVVVVMTATSLLNWLVYHMVLAPLRLEHLHLIVFIVVIAGFVQVLEMVIDRVSETLYNALGIYLPLIAVNCAVLGACLFMVIREYTLGQAVGYGFGAGAGWALAILLMAGIRIKMERSRSRIPAGLDGAGIALVIAGIMALAFIGFNGMLTGK
jgi:Na+-transporting NADH:ubiquinone oxidoreductase subunit E